MSWHDEETVGSVHVPYNWSYADAAARTGASGFVAGDVGKLARQEDDNTLWMLTATTPTWIAVGSGGIVPAHDLGGASHNADTLAHLNSKISDATLDDSGDPRDPNAHGAAAHTGSIGAHSQITSVGANDHHNEDHASRHVSGGADAVKLDDLSAPDDNTDLNATTSAHGLLLKLGGGTTNFLRADGSWASPTATVANIDDIGDVDASSPNGGAKLFFNDNTTKWEDELLPMLKYGDVFDEDWAPTWAELEANGPVAFGNSSLSLTGMVGNATVATINALSPAANDSYVVTDAGTITSGSVVVTAGAVVVYTGTVWTLVMSGVGGYVLNHLRVQLSSTTALISPYTDGTDDGKIVYFDGTSNTGIETTLDVKLTLPSISGLPFNDGMLRRVYVGNFSGGSGGFTRIDIASAAEFIDGLTEVEITDNGQEVMLAAISGSLSQTWARVSNLETHIQLRRAATWASSNFSSAAALPFDTQDSSANEAIFGWSSTVNPSRISIGLTGHYHISGFANIDSTGGVRWNCEAWVRKNGTTEIAGTRIRTGNYGNEDQEMTLPVLGLELEDGDYLEWVFDHSNLTGNMYSATLSVSKRY